MLSKRFLIFILFVLPFKNIAQENNNNVTSTPTKPNLVLTTFKSLKVINAQTVNLIPKKTMCFSINHRFGNIAKKANGGVHTLYGFDVAEDIRFSFDYGLTQNLQIGFGRSKREENLDGNLKFKPLTQKASGMPISVVWFSNMIVTPRRDVDNRFTKFYYRMSFAHQLILSRKFYDRFSLQILPTLVHRNLVEVDEYGIQDENTFFSIGFACSVVITKSIALIADYFYNFSDYRINHPFKNYYNPLGVGFEIETRGHVFQLTLTNTSGILENNFIPYTYDSWTNGGIKFGFQISRAFNL